MSLQLIILLVLAVVGVIGAAVFFLQQGRPPREETQKEGPDPTHEANHDGDGGGSDGGGGGDGGGGD